MTETDPHGLTAPYAVDAVTDTERREAEDHLAGCPGCRAELVELAAALGEYGGGAPVVPRPALRAAVMAGLDDVLQLPAAPSLPMAGPTPIPAAVLTVFPDGGAAADPTGVPPAPAAPVAAPAPKRRGEHAAGHHRHRDDDLAVRRAARRRRVLPLLSAAAAAVVLAAAAVLGITAVHYRQDRDAAQQAAVTLAQVAAAPDAVTVAASATTDPTWSQTKVVISRRRGEAVLIPAGTRPAPAGRTWQLWFVDAAGARSAGTFRSGGSTGAQLLAGRPGAASAVAVSLEPAGGSAAPTTTPVATYPVPSA